MFDLKFFRLGSAKILFSASVEGKLCKLAEISIKLLNKKYCSKLYNSFKRL